MERERKIGMRRQNVCLVNWWKTGTIPESKTTKQMKMIQFAQFGKANIKTST